VAIQGPNEMRTFLVFIETETELNALHLETVQFTSRLKTGKPLLPSYINNAIQKIPHPTLFILPYFWVVIFVIICRVVLFFRLPAAR